MSQSQKNHTMDWRMERQAPFLKSVLQEADNHKRQEMLRMANADQINAISKLVMNTIRGTVPRSRHGFAARDGSAVKSHSTILQRLRRQISLDYYTIPPATQGIIPYVM